MARLCSIEGCGNPHYGLGLCNRHRLRLVRHGDPLAAAPKKIRQVILNKDHALIPLSQGLFAVIDLEDVSLVSGRNWHAVKDGQTFYALDSSKNKLHSIVAGHKDGHVVDHEDGDGLNNRRSNLRFATASQNQFNKRLNRNNATGFKGVRYASWARGAKKWRAGITLDHKYISLGYHLTPEAAAAAYDQAAQAHFGVFARLNSQMVGG